MVPASADSFPEDFSPDYYTIERELGRGGMATVYAARDTKHGRRVALKVLKSELAATLGAERFRREIALAASLQHPHIVSVYDSGKTTSGTLWFTMPLIEGESLRDRLRRQRQLPLEEALRITREVALALDYAHRHGVIHRDVKPENILVVDGQAMVADFGIARPMMPGVAGETLTATGMTLGTPVYMSPEQAAGDREIGAATDIYSLGVVLYEMLAGEPPYTGPTAQAIAAKMMTGDVPSIRRTRASVPQAVDAAVRRALSPVPADRFATAAMFANAVDTAEHAASAPIVGAASGAPAARPRIPAGGVVLALGILIGAGSLFAWRRHESGAVPPAAAGPVQVAVLPFDSEGDTANAYFADGIADEIRGKLSALPALQVMARTSSNAYRRTLKPAAEIAQELGVHYLLSGTVRWERAPSGTRRVRVSPELIEIEAGRGPVTKWQQSYDTTLADVFDVQSAVATRVADNLGVVLSPPVASRLAARPTQNLAAYDAYLRSTALDQLEPATERRALAAAEQAVALDSGFAEAWARISLLHLILYANSTGLQAQEDSARQAADRVLALDPKSSDGYYVLGAYTENVLHNLPAARAAFETAIKLNPSSPLAVGGIGSPEAAMGQLAVGLAHARQATALDPRSTIAAARVAMMLVRLRRYREARVEAERALATTPTDLMLIGNRTASFLGKGDLAGARAALRDVPPTLDRATLVVYLTHLNISYWSSAYGMYWALDSADRALLLTLPPAAFDDNRGDWGLVRAELYWLNADTLSARRYADSAVIALGQRLPTAPEEDRWHLRRGLALAYFGQRPTAVQEGERGLALARATGDGYHIPYARHMLAKIYAAVGDYSHALDQLDSLLAEPYGISPAWLKIDPTWAPLRADPRFQQLLEQSATSPLPTG